jgi:hypothetical protein
MEDSAGELVPVLMAIELEQHAAPDGFIINIGEDMGFTAAIGGKFTVRRFIITLQRHFIQPAVARRFLCERYVV